MRVAAVDLGTNSTRLLVADVDGGRVEEIARVSEITRLGEGVDERRKLLPLPVARVRNVLSDYRREAERLGAERVLAIGTSAVRDAENGEAFLGEVEWSYGFVTRLLTGDEEAELTLRGVATGRPLDEGTLVLDVGGGSTELITATGQRTSIDVGSVRLTERHLRSDPPAPGALAAAAREVRDLLPALAPRPRSAWPARSRRSLRSSSAATTPTGSTATTSRAQRSSGSSSGSPPSRSPSVASFPAWSRSGRR